MKEIKLWITKERALDMVNGLILFCRQNEKLKKYSIELEELEKEIEQN